MFLISTTFMLLFLFSACTDDFLTTSYVPGMSSASHYSRVNDKEIQFVVTWDELVNTPDWFHDKPLPFDLNKTVDIASKQFVKFNQDIESWSLESINVKRFGETDKWYYLISFERKAEKGSTKPSDDYLRIPIMFSGKAIASQ